MSLIVSNALDTTIRPSNWQPSRAVSKTRSPHAASSAPDRATLMVMAEALRLAKPRVLRSGQSDVHVTLHVVNSPHGLTYYASVVVDDWLVMKTDTFVFDAASSSVWLLSVPVFVSDPKSSTVRVTRILEQPNLTHKLVESQPLTVEVHGHTPCVIDMSVHDLSLAEGPDSPPRTWSAHILLVPGDAAALHVNPEDFMQHDAGVQICTKVYAAWAVFGADLRNDIGNMNQNDARDSAEVSVKEFRNLVSNLETVQTHMYRIFTALHLSHHSTLLHLMATPDHPLSEIQSQLRLGPQASRASANVSPAQCLVNVQECKLIAGQAVHTINNLRTQCQLLNRTCGDNLDDLVHCASQHMTKGDFTNVTDSIRILGLQRTDVCKMIAQERQTDTALAVQNNVMRVRGLYMVVNCIDDCIVSNVDCLLGLPGRQNGCIHRFLLAEWHVAESVSTDLVSELQTMCHTAMGHRPASYARVPGTEICNQILKYRYLKSLLPPTKTTSNGRRAIAAFISTEHCQEYNNTVPPHTLDLHPQLLRLAPVASGDHVAWYMVIQGLAQLCVITATTRDFIVRVVAKMTARDRIKSTQPTADDIVNCERICAIFRKTSPLFSLARRVLAGEKSRQDDLAALLNAESTLPHLHLEELRQLNLHVLSKNM